MMIFLSAAVVSVPLTQRLGLGSVIGYLISGVLIGPSGLGWIGSPEEVLQLSELGVVFLLFLVGLELNPTELWRLRKSLLGMGGLQMLGSIGGLLALLFLTDGHWSFATVAALGFAMSSTALVLQLLTEKSLLKLPIGEACFSVLLFQDLSVVPVLALIPILKLLDDGANQTTLAAHFEWIAVGKGALAILGVVILGRLLLRPLFRFIARTNLREIFIAFSLLLILSVSLLMHSVGLSMALGAFIAGLLLANSEYRHELEIDIEPFKGLLLGLFFIAVGMTIHIQSFLASPSIVLSLVLKAVVIKFIVLFAVAQLFKMTPAESTLFALFLSQGGEFAFLLFSVAKRFALITDHESSQLSVAVTLSMATTPILLLIYEKWILPKFLTRPVDLKKYQVQDEGNPVILAGYGRMGQVIGRLLHSQQIGLTILELDPGQIEVVRRFGWKTFYGDVSRLDLLRAAGAEHAKLLILAIDDMDAAVRTIKLVKENFPNLKILVRSESRLDTYQLMNLKVPVVRATFSPGLEMGEKALKLLNYPAYEAHKIALKFTRYDERQLEKASQHMGDERTLISLSQESREELVRIMKTDDQRFKKIFEGEWD